MFTCKVNNIKHQSIHVLSVGVEALFLLSKIVFILFASLIVDLHSGCFFSSFQVFQVFAGLCGSDILFTQLMFIRSHFILRSNSR